MLVLHTNIALFSFGRYTPGIKTAQLKYFQIVINLSMLTAVVAATTVARAQDAHFTQGQDMNIWYNPALKTNKLPQAHISIRSVNYPNIIAYTSKAATIELPLIGRDKDREDDIPFMNLAAGINAESSNDRFMNVSTAMMAFSYALPLNGDDTYLAAGFQGAYTFSRVGLGTFDHFPDQFDKYGALGPAIASDPFQSGYSYGYFTAGAGVSVFHNGEKKQWYLGGSILHFNHPYTEWTHAARLQANNGIQAGYMTAITNEDAIGGYASFSWQDGINKHFIGAIYTRNLDDSAHNAISCGAGYRIGDAVIPDIGLTVGGSRFAFYYEINLPGAALDYYNRRAFAFSYRLNL